MVAMKRPKMRINLIDKVDMDDNKNETDEQMREE